MQIYGFFSLRETLAVSANAREIQAFSDVQIYYLMSDHPEKGGLGYPPWFRERALRFLDGAAGETKDERVQATAETFSVSASSIYAWAARKRDEGTVETKARAGGVPRSLSGVGDVLLLLYMGTRCSVIVFTRIGLRLVAYPNVTKAKYAYWVGGALGQPVSEEMIGDALNRMRVTRKHIHKTAVEQDPLRFAVSALRTTRLVFGRNVLFETCAPPWGFKGVSLPRLVDVDESFALLCEADRTTGYAFIGQRAEIVSTYTKGTRYNIMLAVGYTGLVNYWIHRENCTGEVRFVVFHVVLV